MSKKINIDEQWLRNEYRTKSISAIAQSLNISRTTVRLRLKEYGVKRRGISRAVSLAQLPSREVADKLWDRDWLFYEYVSQQKSMQKIASNLGVSTATVLKALNDAGILRRSLSEATSLRQRNHLELSPSLLEFIEGEILGDGHLRSESEFSASYSHSSKHKEYICWLSKKLSRFGVSQSGKMVTNKNGASISFNYCSRAYYELRTLRERWYPGGKKRIPLDLKLTPIKVRQWYIGDGSLLRDGKTAVIAVCSRSDKEVDRVRSLFAAIVGRRPRFWRATRIIAFNAELLPLFFDYIGNCPDEILPIYGYKWPRDGDK